MRVLLVGSGGREHALGWKLVQSSRVTDLLCLPGNPGLAALGSVVENVDPEDVGAVAALARIHGVDLVVVGPEGPLAAGVVDAVSHLGIPVFGPLRAAARLESSKRFAKEVMDRAGVATGIWEAFSDAAEAHHHITQTDGPYVVKADGLAAGKGVLVTDSAEAAHVWVDRCLDGGFGDAGRTVIIEEHLAGPEVSVFAVCAGTEAVPLAPARDYKRLGDGDSGPNTGGMGAYSPVTDFPDDMVEWTMDEVVRPTLRAMADQGNPFTGFLYTGLVLTDDGPKVLEFNVRLGDPETQVILPRLATDLVDLIEDTLAGRTPSPTWSNETAVEVVLAAAGYPESPHKGDVITGLDRVGDEVLVFHAGTADEGGRLMVDGGRVLNLVALGATIETARRRVYAAVDGVRWPGMQYRTDIASD